MLSLASTTALTASGYGAAAEISDVADDTPSDHLVLGASASSISVYFFWATGCPHCALIEPFIEEMKEKYPQVTFRDYDVRGNTDNWNLYQDFNHRYNVEHQVVPEVFVGDHALLSEDEIRGQLEGIIVDMIEASIVPPSAPQNLRATPGDTYVNLRWSSPSSNGGAAITSYEVWRGSTSGTETFLVDVGTSMSYNNTGLTNDQTYYYVVKAENVRGLSPASSEAFARPSETASVPAAPQDLAATAGNGSVILTWSPPANDGGSTVTGYTVYRGTSTGGEAPVVTLDNVQTYADTSVQNGTMYYYRVSALNAIGEGSASSEVTALTGIPSAPTGLNATAGDSSVTLNWTAPSVTGDGTITYHVFRNGTEVWNGTGTEYVDKDLVNGVSYTYTVVANNSVGWGMSSVSVQSSPVRSSDNSMDLTIPAIIVAAAVDSINPCAISVMIFLLIFLTSLGNKRRVLAVGLVYILTVYVVYFLAGLGLLTFLASTSMTRYVFYGAAILSIIIGVINIKDFFFPGDKPTVAIPESRKPLIKKYIEKASIPAAVVLGALVSMFELPCTGGIYLAILSLLGDKMTVTQGMPYLALYNLIFVLPLAVILVVIYLGVSAERANSWRLENRSWLRLVIGAVMLLLGAMMLLGVF